MEVWVTRALEVVPWSSQPLEVVSQPQVVVALPWLFLALVQTCVLVSSALLAAKVGVFPTIPQYPVLAGLDSPGLVTRRVPEPFAC